MYIFTLLIDSAVVEPLTGEHESQSESSVRFQLRVPIPVFSIENAVSIPNFVKSITVG